jgi:tRNA-splicing ligase RtcB (3'-phosphate/5'-hydroxy nucleic acid ligase)
MSSIREEAVPYKVWGTDIEQGALEQMRRAAELIVSVRGALMPDAHQGYGLPIGGVLATEGAVIPYAVGVDIACRMKMTIFDAAPLVFEQKQEKFRKAIEDCTRFGIGKGTELTYPPDHPVMEDIGWRELAIAREMKNTAWKQLGSSGSGNHFVEFGELTVSETISGEGTLEGEGSRTYGNVPPGTYIALLSHSGSRGFGAQVADLYTEIAMSLHPELPKEYKHLAWLDLDKEGAEYWAAMNLAGRYASANHHVIHELIADKLRLDILGGVENHHNFAWKEQVDGRELIVHRKGATPAGAGVFGVIPGSMTAPGFVVRGLGNDESMSSAAHGAGRRMSRSQAMKSLTWEQVKHKLKSANVELLSAGLDEAPNAYKDIREVMAAQADLVLPVAEFKPRLVKMDAGKGGDRRKDKKRK